MYKQISNIFIVPHTDKAIEHLINNNHPVQVGINFTFNLQLDFMLNEVYIDRFIDSPKDLNHAVVVIGYTTGVDMNDCNNTDNYSTCRHTVFGDCSTKATPFSRPRIERRDMRQMSWDMNLIIDLDNELGENLCTYGGGQNNSESKYWIIQNSYGSNSGGYHDTRNLEHPFKNNDNYGGYLFINRYKTEEYYEKILYYGEEWKQIYIDIKIDDINKSIYAIDESNDIYVTDFCMSNDFTNSDININEFNSIDSHLIFENELKKSYGSLGINVSPVSISIENTAH